MAERDLEAAKRALFELTNSDTNESSLGPSFTPKADTEGRVIEGTFNGENMVGPNGKIYPVPANYASKSKLVEGDGLKLTILDDGTFVFKQIAPVKRKNVVGELTFSDNAYHVTTEDGTFNVLYASVTYHKGKPGDKVTIVIPESGRSGWAALEGIIHDYDNLNRDEKREEVAPVEAANDAHLESEPTPELPSDVEIRMPEASKEEEPKAPEAEAPIVNDEVKKEPKLDVSDMDIKSPGTSPTPEATTPRPEKTRPTDGPAEPISEMDI